ncbi:MAG: tetratricopeptide repeat protein [Chitinophagales bacterium]
MRTKILTLLVIALTFTLSAQPPAKIWSNNADPRSQAIRDFARGNYLDCIMNCQKLSAMGANDGLVTGLMAMAYDSLTNYEAASKSLSVLKEYKVDSSILRRLAAADMSPEIYKRNILNSGASFYNTSRFDSSEVFFTEFLKLAPNDTFAIFFLANSQFYQGKYEQAVVNYKRLLDMDFNRPDIHNLVGVSLMLQNNFLGARDYFSQAILLDKNLGVAYFNLGKVQYGLQDRNAALQTLTQAYSFVPKDSNCVALLSQIYLEQGDNVNAEKFLAKLYALNRNNEKVGWNLVNIALKNKDYEHASAYLQNIIRMSPKKSEGYSKLGETYIQMNSFEQAFNNYENALVKVGENRNFLYGAGMCANKIGLYGKAVEHLNKAAELDATYAKTFKELGDAYTGMKKKKLAKLNYKKANSLGLEKEENIQPQGQLQAKN